MQRFYVSAGLTGNVPLSKTKKQKNDQSHFFTDAGSIDFCQKRKKEKNEL